MSTIGAIGSNAGAWPAMGSPGRMKEQLFAKVDADGSGGVDTTELQGLLDYVASKSGVVEDRHQPVDRGRGHVAECGRVKKAHASLRSARQQQRS